MFVAFLGSALGVPVICAQGPPVSGEKGALVLVVTRWNSSCDADNRRRWDNMIDGWYDDITDDRETPWGHGGNSWWKDGFYENGNIVDSDFTDSRIVAWGNDDCDDCVDEGDAVMIGLHGSNGTGGRWNAHVRVDETGAGNCVSWQGHMLFGDYDLEFLHLSSCHSADFDVWSEWGDSFDGLHQMDGFHGVMYVTSLYDHRYEGFSDDAFNTSIADSWVDNLYKYRSRHRNQCPVAIGVGNGASDLWDRMDNEQYDWVYHDPDVWTHQGRIWIEDCDPRGAGTLP
jgi:hypothetical protein